MSVVCVSGGFDPLHVGHVRYIQHAARFGDVTVILNTDEWLKRKKGYSFMSWDQRAEILMAIKGVKQVVKADDDDGTVCKNLVSIVPDIFAKGGDRWPENTPELSTCHELNINILWGCGGDKIESSSALVRAARA